jgi:hypothetical protein
VGKGGDVTGMVRKKQVEKAAMRGAEEAEG